MNRRYIATLAGVASLILVIGLLIKPSDAVRVPVPVAEAVGLQQLSQESDLRAEANYFAERIAAVASQTVYLPDLGVSAVRWDSIGTVVTTLPDAPVFAVRYTETEDTIRIAAAAPQMDRSRWVIAVGRHADGSTVSAVGLYGGIATTQCADGVYREIIIDVPLHHTLAGAGLYDLNGRRMGLVVHCGNRLAALPAEEVTRAVAESRSMRVVVRDLLGISVATLDARMSSYFNRNTGVLVREVTEGGPAETWGLRPGDIIDSVDGKVVNSLEDLAPLLTSTASHIIGHIRNNARTELRVSAVEAGNPTAASQAGLTLSDGWTTITSVNRGTALQRAGLLPGDRIIQVDDATRPTVAVVQRALARADTVAVFIVFQRGSARRGVLISAR